MRRLAFILFWFAAALVSSAAETNYLCVICGQRPLTGRIWMAKWGAICDECYKLENRCSLCGIPIGKGFVKTGDGRFICKFDRPNTVLDVAEAREIFTDTRRELVGLFGSGFALKYPEVTVSLFNVDYWSEAGRGDGLHKFGFASTRQTPSGSCTHEVVLLSGRRRSELIATAAHEYTHLWINENRPPKSALDADTVEAICELAAFKLAASGKMPEQQQRIMENPYTHGKINTLVALENQHGIAYILNWVKTGTGTNFAAAALATIPPVMATNVPPPLPRTLQFTGLSIIGSDREAIINGLSFAAGEQKRIKLREKTVLVRCCEIRDDEVSVQLDDAAALVRLKLGGAPAAPR